MGVFPPGAWELPRKNFAAWASDLNDASPSTGLNNARTRIFELGGRLDAMSRIIMHEDDEDDDFDDTGVSLAARERATMPPPPVPAKSRRGRNKLPEDPPIDNDPAVSDSSSFNQF